MKHQATLGSLFLGCWWDVGAVCCLDISSHNIPTVPLWPSHQGDTYLVKLIQPAVLYTNKYNWNWQKTNDRNWKNISKAQTSSRFDCLQLNAQTCWDQQENTYNLLSFLVDVGKNYEHLQHLYWNFGIKTKFKVIDSPHISCHFQVIFRDDRMSWSPGDSTLKLLDTPHLLPSLHCPATSLSGCYILPGLLQ